MDVHGRLIVRRCAEDLALSGRDRGIALDEACRYATECFDTERKRGDIQQNHVVDLSAENTALDRRACRNHFVGIDTLVRFAVEDAFCDFLDFRHSGHAADKDDLVDFILAQAGILDAGFTRRN